MFVNVSAVELRRRRTVNRAQRHSPGDQERQADVSFLPITNRRAKTIGPPEEPVRRAE